MTSKQVMLTVAALFGGGCAASAVRPMASPYPSRRIFAVAPLNNESGSLHADGVVLADHLSRQFETAPNIDVVPVNRIIAAMETRSMSQVQGRGDALRLLSMLNVDALLVGTIRDYDPYDPPKLGLVIELYADPRWDQSNGTLDVRRLTRSPSGVQNNERWANRDRQPLSVVSAFFDADSVEVGQAMRRWAQQRGSFDHDGRRRIFPLEPPADDQTLRLIRISMDLFTQFVSHEMCWRLLEAERRRLSPVSVTQADP